MRACAFGHTGVFTRSTPRISRRLASLPYRHAHLPHTHTSPHFTRRTDSSHARTPPTHAHLSDRVVRVVTGLKVIGGKMTEAGYLGAFITKVKKGSIADTVGHLRPGESSVRRSTRHTLRLRVQCEVGLWDWCRRRGPVNANGIWRYCACQLWMRQRGRQSYGGGGAQ